MKRQQIAGSTVVNVVVILVVLVVVAAVLFPLFARHRHITVASPCQSNLKQIGSAIKMYLVDWQDHYPTNRPYVAGRKLGPIAESVRVTLQDTGEEPRYDNRLLYGADWVDGLYPYYDHHPIPPPARFPSALRCPVASLRRHSRSMKAAAATYALNRNLVEKPERIVRHPANLLLVREMDRLVYAELRPMNDSTWTSRHPPISPFLTDFDRWIGKTDPNLHAKGSNMLLADGHVKYYEISYYPSQKDITKAKCWNPETKQWFNFYWAKPKTHEQRTKNMSIAITP